MSTGATASATSRVQDELLRLAQLAKTALHDTTSRESVESVRVEFLGKKGKVSELLREMGKLPADERPAVGKVANEVRDQIEALIGERVANIEEKERGKSLSERIDITLPGRKNPRGSVHPLVQTSEAILDVLHGLGFERVTGPEIEHDFYNFEALNIPADHPAREMQDTFYVADDVVLRTQTSPVQVRTMLTRGTPPIRIASFGRVYRRDQDITHSPVFHQIEGLYVDKDVTFADLKGTLQAFVENIFAPGVRLRLRPSFFPFTEPSCEIDMSCFSCDGKDAHCRLCKGSGWIEILGAGMVDPEVFRACGFDPDKVSGFAFGIGVERVAMLRHGVSDIRLFFENDVRFLRQF